MLIINATFRRNKGKSANRRLRIANKFPAIIYGGIESPIPIELDQDIILNLYNKETFYKKILIIIVEDKENKVKVQAVQHHPFKSKLVHVDFIRV